jgi:hypothetical protein
MADSGTARHAASRILSQPEFHPRAGRSFDPLGGVLRFIGRVTRDVLSPVARALEVPFVHLERYIGRGGALVLGLVVFAGIVAFAVALIVRRRARTGAERAQADRAIGAGDPDELDRLAAEAERAGDFDTAVRLRFEAGLARLERRGLVAARTTRTSGDLAHELGSPTFERLAADLESIVYAERAASPEQVAASQELWSQVPEEAGRRR